MIKKNAFQDFYNLYKSNAYIQVHISGINNGYAYVTLSSDTIKKQGIFDHTFINRLINNHNYGKVDNSKTLWSIIKSKIRNQMRRLMNLFIIQILWLRSFFLPMNIIFILKLILEWKKE